MTVRIKYISFVLIVVTNLLYSQNISVRDYYGINLKLNTFFENVYIPKMTVNGDIKAPNSSMWDNSNSFCPDGLRPRGPKTTSKWESSNIKLLFLLKDSNGNSDARDYYLVWGPTIKPISRLVYGFHNIDIENKRYPLRNRITNENEIKAFNEYPHAWVNIKKSVGVSRVNYNIIIEFAKKYKKETLREIDILKPNVIICGGTFDIAKKYIFNDFEIEQINDIVYYLPKKKIILIKSYHPSAIVTNYEKYEVILDSYLDGINVISKKYGRFVLK